MNNKIAKLQQGDYFKWNNLSREDKVKRNKQIAKQYLDKGPSIQNYYNALKAYFGGFNPKNPYLQTGEPIITPGMNPTKGVQNATKAIRTLEDYLKTTKVAAPMLEGSSTARSAYATDRFLGGQMFESSLPEEAMKVQGHGMAKSSTIQDALARLRYILDNGFEKGKTFYTAPLKLSEEGKQFGAYLGTAGGTPYFDGHFLITGKPGQMINSVDDIGTIYINDAYENPEALKAAQKIKEYLTKAYPNRAFKLYSEGFKKGGSIKTANARKWKHQNGGIIKADEGTKLTLNNWFNSDLGQVVTNGVSQLFNGIQQANNQNKLNDRLQKWKQAYINSIEPEDFSQQVEQEEEQLKQANPDYNSSPIVTAHKKWFLENQALNSVKQKAAQEADQIINKQLLNNQQQSSGGFNIGNIGNMIQDGFGIFGSLQGNKKQATSV